MDDARRALDKAVRSLAMRAHSEKEIVDKLTRAGYEERAIAEAMQKLTEYHLIDDGAFAEQWAAARARRGFGAWRIARELREKGIDGEVADAALAGLDEDAALENATALALKHLRKGDKNARRRAYDAMIRRGFGYDEARAALERAQAQLAEEEEFRE